MVEEKQTGDRLAVGVAIGIALLGIAGRFWTLRVTHSTTEDFFITLRYAENIANGAGFIYNPNERVLGTTTPLYTLFLALVSWLHLNALFIGKAANILADGVTCYLLARLLTALGKPRTGWLAALLYATASAPINFSIGGMETGLVTLAGLAAVYAYVQNRPRGLFVSLAVLFLLRIDGLLLGIILLAAYLWRTKRIPWREVALAAALLLPWILFATLYFGSPIPVSMLAKIQVYTRIRPERLPNLEVFQVQFIKGIPQITLFACFLVGAVQIIRPRSPFAIMRAPLLWLVLYYITMLVSKVIAFGWYFVPPLPIYYAINTLGLLTLLQAFWQIAPLKRAEDQRTPERSLRLLQRSAAGLILLALAMTWHLRSVARDIEKAQVTEDVVRLPIGLWLADHAKPGERALMEPIGYIGYYSRLPILDIVGLVSPEVLPSYQASVPYPLGDIVHKFQPPLLVLRPSERDDLQAYTRATGDPVIDSVYQLEHIFKGTTGGQAFLLYRRQNSAK